MQSSPLERARAASPLVLPKALRTMRLKAHFQEEKRGEKGLAALFPQTFGRPALELVPGEGPPSKPLRVGVVFSGGQASGGHNVLTGLLDGLKALHPESRLIGFLGGPGGIVEGHSREITLEESAPYRNSGGFDLLGSGRTKIEKPEQFAGALRTVQALKLDGLVVVGGDDSNTNAALLAEYFLAEKVATRVVGVPKTIDGDLKNDHIEISFGFDTACGVYAEMVGNIARDALSAKKYTHFIKLMGRSASHIALEVALRTHPNCTLIGEEVAAKRQSLAQIVEMLCDVVESRAKAGKNFGLILVPEGLIEFIPEVRSLIQALNALLGDPEQQKKVDSFTLLEEKRRALKLPQKEGELLASLPEAIQFQLLKDRDPHGNVQVSHIETEKLLIELVQRALQGRGVKFSPVSHFFGYEGRAASPSFFDAHYCYALGHVAAALVQAGVTGYMATVRGLLERPEEWHVGGTPLTAMMDLEQRSGKLKPVIRKALVELEGAPYRQFAQEREQWKGSESYLSPGPLQFFGPAEIVERRPLTLQLEARR